MSSSKLRPILAALWVLTLAGCNGSAVVTMTSTLPQNFFLAYRVGLDSVSLQTAAGKSVQALPTAATVDLVNLGGVSEILGAASVTKGTYTNAVITLDYTSAQIVLDDGSVNGVALTPVNANGQNLGQVQITVDLDPSYPLTVTKNSAVWLALDFRLSASNRVNLVQKTVTVTPIIVASAMPIDSKPVIVRGPLASVNSTDSVYSTGVSPFDSTVSSAGQLQITPSTTTTYEINGTASSGSVGLAQLAALGNGTLAVAFGTLTTSDTTSTTVSGTTSTSATTTTGTTGTTSTTTTVAGLTFTATQVLAGSSVQGSGFDRVSGVVSARSGNTLTMEDATLVTNDGTGTFIPGTTTVDLGANTAVTTFGQGSATVGTGTSQISVGSNIRAFGMATTPGSGDVTLDASAGRVRVGNSNASGLVTAQGSGTVTLNLGSLGGRSIGAFDFSGTGTSGADASAGQYSIATGALDLTNTTQGAPVAVTGTVTAFGAAPPDFTATTLLDPTTIQAELVVDWGSAGTAAPFVEFTGSDIDLDRNNAAIGPRHQITIGSQATDVTGLASDPLIVPNSTSSDIAFSIGHSVTDRVENFDTYAAFITALQSYLNGTNVATNLTAEGLYSASDYTFTATGITVTLNN
jgi:hypothetical protein